MRALHTASALGLSACSGLGIFLRANADISDADDGLDDGSAMNICASSTDDSRASSREEAAHTCADGCVRRRRRGDKGDESRDQRLRVGDGGQQRRQVLGAAHLVHHLLNEVDAGQAPPELPGRRAHPVLAGRHGLANARGQHCEDVLLAHGGDELLLAFFVVAGGEDGEDERGDRALVQVIEEDEEEGGQRRRVG